MASHLLSTMKAAKRVGSGPLDQTLTVSTDVTMFSSRLPIPLSTRLISKLLKLQLLGALFSKESHAWVLLAR
jgi:hypothetical protein